ncbi:CBS domain-containing protein [[Eubacterium] cellulosolvens]
MLPKIEEIERRRKSLGLGQKQLAKMVNVSQSMIAKIESGRINPSYIKTKAIFDLLESLERKREIKAKDIHHGKVVGVQRDDLVSIATDKMHETGYSQLPVFDNIQVVGSISERTVLDQIIKGKDPAQLSKLKVEEVMDEAFPSVDKETPITVLSTLLQYNPAVMIGHKGKIIGIITKADLLKVVSSS